MRHATRVVIADDSQSIRDNLSSFLPRAGFTVVGAAINGREAEMLCAELRPDCVILDLSMGEYGGADAARRIVAAGTAKAVLISSSLASEASQLVAELGIAAITKPYHKQRLIDALSRLTVETHDAGS